MNILELIFKLLLEFVPMENAEFAKMRADGKEWYTNIQTDAGYIENATGTDLMLAKAKLFSDIWYMRAFFAIAYLWGKRQLTIYTNPTFDLGKEEEED